VILLFHFLTKNLNTFFSRRSDIICEHDFPEAISKNVNQFTQVTNKWTKDFCKELQFNLTLTTYAARHSFATILLRSGAPITFASQRLGYTRIMTTQKYFAGFDLAAQAEDIKALKPYVKKEKKFIK